MTVSAVLMAIVTGCLLPVAAANARHVVNPGLTATGAGAAFERGVVPTAENFGRKEDEDNTDHGDNGDHWDDKDRKGDDHHDHGSDRDHKGDDHGGYDHKGDRDGRNGYEHDRSPSRPY